MHYSEVLTNYCINWLLGEALEAVDEAASCVLDSQ